MILLGLAGPAGTGKTTAARHLAPEHGADRMSIAQPLYEILAVSLNITPEAAITCSEVRDWKEGPHEALNGKSPRQMLQIIGDSLRSHLGEMFLIEYLERRIAVREDMNDHIPMVVVPDIRLDIEAEWVRRNGGHIVHMRRKQAEAVAPHCTENGVQLYYKDFAINNHGCIADLQDQIDVIVRQLTEGKAA